MSYFSMRIQHLTDEKARGQIYHDFRIEIPDYINQSKSNKNIYEIQQYEIDTAALKMCRSQMDFLFDELKKTKIKKEDFEEFKKIQKDLLAQKNSKIWKKDFLPYGKISNVIDQVNRQSAKYLKTDDPAVFAVALAFMILLDLLSTSFKIAKLCQPSFEKKQEMSKQAFEEFKQAFDLKFSKSKEVKELINNKKEEMERILKDTKTDNLINNLKEFKNHEINDKYIPDIDTIKTINNLNFQKVSKSTSGRKNFRGKYVATSGVLTFSPKTDSDGQPIEWTQEEIADIKKRAWEGLDEIAKKLNTNIIYRVIHLDEKTPHIHYMFNGMCADGKALAPKFLGDKFKKKKPEMSGSDLQDIMAEFFKGTEFARGVSKEKTGAEHINLKEGQRIEAERLQKYTNKKHQELNNINNEISTKKEDLKIVQKLVQDIDIYKKLKEDLEQNLKEIAQEILEEEAIYEDNTNLNIDNKNQKYIIKKLNEKLKIKTEMIKEINKELREKQQNLNKLNFDISKNKDDFEEFKKHKNRADEVRHNRAIEDMKDADNQRKKENLEKIKEIENKQQEAKKPSNNYRLKGLKLGR